MSSAEPSHAPSLQEVEQLHARVVELERKHLDFQRMEMALAEGMRLAALIRAVSIAFIQGSSFQERLQQCTQALVTHLGAAFARIWTLNEAENILELQASAGMYTHLDGEHARVPVGILKIGLIAKEHKPHLTNTVIGDPRVSDQEWARREGMVAFAGYPLLVEDRLVGVMALFARHQLTETVLEAMASVANAMALGIERHQMEEAMRQSAALQRQDQQRLEIALQEGADRFLFMANAMPQKIFTAKPNGEVDYFNPQWTEFTGLSFEEIRDWGWVQFIHPDDVVENIRLWQQSIDTGEPFYLEHRFRRADGVYRWHVSRAIPRRDAQGHITMWIGSNTDIDDRKQLEERKNAFFSIASHELRTPITVIKGNLQLAERRVRQLLQSSEYPSEQTSQSLRDLSLLLSRALRQTDVQNRLIGDLLDVSRIQEGKLDLSLDLCDLRTLVHGIVLDQQSTVPTRTITLELPETDEPIVIMADADRIGQVISNYLTNALKYSAMSAPVIVGLAQAGKQVRLWVKDQGPGLSKEHQQHIWERFYQASGITVQNGATQGLGLGLHICQTLIARHQGEVGVESTPGYGSTFWFNLPLVDKP